jgi:hypothetical protein
LDDRSRLVIQQEESGRHSTIYAGANPAVFALTVAIATSNSFLIPTHQVNALIMGPGGYHVADFMRAGGIMTVLFLLVMTVVMGLLYWIPQEESGFVFFSRKISWLSDSRSIAILIVF